MLWITTMGRRLNGIYAAVSVVTQVVSGRVKDV